MFHKMGLPLLVMFLAIGSQDGAVGLHLNNGLDDCGEDTYSSCEYGVKFGECEKDPLVKQSCSFSCSLSGQLWEAAWTGNKSTVELTIAAGANPLCAKRKEYNNRGFYLYNYTAIHMAARFGHPGIIKTLLNVGVDVNLQTTEGKTPFYIAATKGPINVLDILIENNANVNIPDSDGLTPLIAAVAYGRLSIVKALISANASLDVTGGWRGDTALHNALWEGNQDVVALLMDNGADSSITNNTGLTPADFARSKGHNQLADLIESYPTTHRLILS